MFRDVMGLVLGVAGLMLLLTVVMATGSDLCSLPWVQIGEWLRTLATLGGFGLAILAYRKWRRPDDAKRRADLAQAVLRQLHKVQTGVSEARTQGVTVYLDGQKASLADKMEEARTIAALPRSNKIFALEELLQGLQVYQAEVDHVYRDTNAGTMLKQVCGEVKKVKDAYTFVAFLNEMHRKMVGDAKFEALLDSTLSTLGSQRVLDSQTGVERDDFGTEFTAKCDVLKGILAHYLVGN